MNSSETIPIRVSQKTKDTIDELASSQGITVDEVIERAIENYIKKRKV